MQFPALPFCNSRGGKERLVARGWRWISGMSAGRKEKSGPQKLCDVYKNALKNLSEIFWSADLILALLLRIFPVSMVLCCRVRACAGSRFGAIPPPFHPKSGKRSGGRYRSRDQGVDFCEKARLHTAAAVRKTAQLCQKSKKPPTKRSVLFC